VKGIAMLWAVSVISSSGGCTFHAGVGGMRAVHGDGKTGDTALSKGTFAATVGGGPCFRWPRLRASITAEVGLRGASFVPFGATEAMWIFREGAAKEGDGHTVRARRSMAIKSRLAGGWNGLADDWVAEAGIGLTFLTDVISDQGSWGSSSQFSGNFHAISFDLVATYAPERIGEDEVWLGGQLTYHANSFAVPHRTRRSTPLQGYQKPHSDQSTDCNSGHLP
jgi:hypothetical protein